MAKMISDKTVKIYQDSSGKEPYRIWIRTFTDMTTKARIQQRIRRLEMGNFGDCKFVGLGVWELRLDFGPGYRVYYAEEGNKIIILLCGGNKKTQQRDIEKAQFYWQEYKGERP
jgi:putative addiction module killer protein